VHAEGKEVYMEGNKLDELESEIKGKAIM